MKKSTTWMLLSPIMVLALIPFLVLGWLGYSYLQYGLETKQACQGYEWEAEADCAAQFALDKNDPRYCRINLLGNVGDMCAMTYAANTTDPTTCKKIDLLRAEDKCQQRFQ